MNIIFIVLLPFPEIGALRTRLKGEKRVHQNVAER